jgi:hypothetical protein
MSRSRRTPAFLYNNGLLLACLGLFAVFSSAWWCLARRPITKARPNQGQAAISAWRYATTSQFWFESMQNWQSEFIAVAAIVGLSIFLRQRGSAESKPVAEPHRHTSA